MDRPKAKSLAGALLVTTGILATTASPAGTPIGFIKVRASELLVYQVDEVIAHATTMDEFAARLAYRAREYTRREGVEACAQLCRSPDGERWGATLITIGSHAACPKTALCPAGFDATGVDLHTHIDAAAYRPSELDRAFLRVDLARGQWASTDPGDFSADDLADGPGYLVTKYRLLHQDGYGRVRTLRDMRQPAPAAE